MVNGECLMVNYGWAPRFTFYVLRFTPENHV
jgi:hypothetical protein